MVHPLIDIVNIQVRCLNIDVQRIGFPAQMKRKDFRQRLSANFEQVGDIITAESSRGGSVGQYREQSVATVNAEPLFEFIRQSAQRLFYTPNKKKTSVKKLANKSISKYIINLRKKNPLKC